MTAMGRADHRSRVMKAVSSADRDSRRGKYHAFAMLPSLLVLTVASAAVMVHWPALSARALSFDDSQYLTENTLVQTPSAAAAWRFLREVWAPSTVRGYYQPLAMISLMLDCAMGGSPENLAPFHRTSLALHAANSALVVVLLHMLVGNSWAAAMAGLLFAVHPMTVEPIPWVGERKTLLATFFALWALVAYVRYVKTSRWAWYAATLAAMLLALMSKPTTTPLSVLFLILDYWPLQRMSRHAVIEKIPFLALSALFAVITYVSQKDTASVYDPSKEYSAFAIPYILCHNIIFYPWKILWPVNLTSYYDFPKPMAFGHPMVRMGVIGTAMLIPTLIVSLRWTRALLAGWGFFFVAILPTMGIVGFTVVIASDKYAYLPVVGFLLILAWALAHPWGETTDGSHWNSRRLAIVAAVVLLAVLESRATRRYLALWQNSEALLRHMIRHAPDVAKLHGAFGLMLAREGRYSEAIPEWEKALSLEPWYAEGHYNLGLGLARLGRGDEAIPCYREAIRLQPVYPDAHNNLGNELARQGKLDEAITHYQLALAQRPDYAEAYNNLGVALIRLNRVDDAVGQYRMALSLNPAYVDARYNLCSALVRQGQLLDAIECYQAVLASLPQDAEAHVELAKCLVRADRLAEAVSHLRRALDLQPDFTDAKAQLARLQREHQIQSEH